MSKGKAARAKGNRYEAKIASDFRDEGFPAQTTRSLRGGYQGDEDVLVENFQIYVECKAVERGSIHKWMAKARGQARDRLITIFWKRDGRGQDGGELVIMTKEDFMELWREGCDKWWDTPAWLRTRAAELRQPAGEGGQEQGE